MQTLPEFVPPLSTLSRSRGVRHESANRIAATREPVLTKWPADDLLVGRPVAVAVENGKRRSKLRHAFTDRTNALRAMRFTINSRRAARRVECVQFDDRRLVGKHPPAIALIDSHRFEIGRLAFEGEQGLYQRPPRRLRDVRPLASVPFRPIGVIDSFGFKFPLVMRAAIDEFTGA